jgi:hypothetical protein
MFVAAPVNGGVAPTFTWVNFVGPGADTLGTGDTLYYTPTHGDYVRLVMHRDNICALPDPATYSEYINVYPHVTPTVEIRTITNGTSNFNITHIGEVVTFYTDVTYGGPSPTFQWYRNNVAIPGATNSSYSTPIYQSDTFWCKIVGTPPCYGSINATSNYIIVRNTLGSGQLSALHTDLSLFPNPNTGDFVLSGLVAMTEGNELNIEVTDVLGHVIYKGATVPVNGQVLEKIALGNDIAPGTYLVRIRAEQVNQTFHFVVSR